MIGRWEQHVSLRRELLEQRLVDASSPWKKAQQVICSMQSFVEDGLGKARVVVKGVRSSLILKLFLHQSLQTKNGECSATPFRYGWTSQQTQRRRAEKSVEGMCSVGPAWFQGRRQGGVFGVQK